MTDLVMTDLPSLVSAAQQGDKDAFGQIVIRFQDMAFASAYAVVGDPGLAQDTAQDAFLEAWLNLSKLQQPGAFPGWFRRIVLGKSHRQIRGKAPQTIAFEDFGSLYANFTEPADALEAVHLRQSVQEAMMALPDHQRMAVALFYIEGYSHKEIAAFLEAPVSTVKKRLFDARAQLQKRMIPMLQKTLQSTRPSQDSEFTDKVQFFIALRDNDLSQIKKLVTLRPSLLQATTEWKMALGHHYWPIGSTALHLSAAGGINEILDYLLAQHIDINEKNSSGLTALHMATLMRQTTTVQFLLQRGAAVNAQSETGQTPLHQAVIRQTFDLAQLLLNQHADPSVKDASGKSALDWALLRQNQTLVDLLVQHGAVAPTAMSLQSIKPALGRTKMQEQWLGRIVDGKGKALDGGVALKLPVMTARSSSKAAHQSAQLATGMKIIDLLAPLPRGGQIGIFTPLSGVGLMVVLGNLIHAIDELYGGSTVWLLMESDALRAADQKLVWRESAVDDKMVFVAGNQQDAPAAQRQTVETALAIAEQLRSEGREVLLLVDSQFATFDGVTTLLCKQTTLGTGAAITTVYHGHHTVGVEPAVFEDLDAVITFDYQRAKARLYPAIDPVRSRSRLLENESVSPLHRQVAAAAQRLLQRYADLRAPMEIHSLGVDALWYIEDDPNLTQEIGRARKLDRFLTQSFYGAEPWTGVVGQLVSVEDTVAGGYAIIEGKMDKVDEEEFRFVGMLDEVNWGKKK